MNQLMTRSVSFKAGNASTRKQSEDSAFLRYVLAHANELVALSALDDKTILTRLKREIPSAARQSLAESTRQLASIFARISTMLGRDLNEPIFQDAEVRSNKMRKVLVAEKQIVTSGEFTEALGISRQALSKAVKMNRCFLLEYGGENYYPRFFADQAFDRRKLERISKALGDLSGWSKWLFFTTPKLTLGEATPLAALKKRMYKEVLQAAIGHVSV